MKIYILIWGLLLCACLKAQEPGGRQSVLKIEASGEALAKVLEKIEQQTPYSFIYDARVIDLSFPVRKNLEGTSLFDILYKLFEDTDIVYTIVNRQIILNKKERVMRMQQNSLQRVTGKVIDKNGGPIAGANVVIKGTIRGTVTDIDGSFVLELPLKATLQVSYIGYLPAEIAYDGELSLQIRLSENTQQLQEVVVTALGLSKKEASLPYATQLVTGEELVRVKDLNFIQTLAGKTAGVQINRASSGLGSSARVVIRGHRSVSGNNQPLYIIDGIPMLNTTSEQAVSAIGGTANAGNRDGGDGISNLNPDDIENMTILKGGAAAALYGVQAGNGVIMITTKRGQPGLQRFCFSSALTVEQAICLPEFQNKYGRVEGSTLSWGERTALPVYDQVGDFFRSGLTAVHSLSASTGNEKLQTYISYANTTARGIVDKNTMNKHNMNLRETARLFDGRLRLDANVSMLVQSIRNKPTTGGFYMNPLPGLYTFPRGMDIGLYKNDFEVYDEKRNMPVQNWYTTITDFEQNPYWLVNRVQSWDKRARAIASVSAEWKLSEAWTLQGRGSIDYLNDKFQQKVYASTSQGIAGVNGRYIDFGYQETLAYGDLMAVFNQKWNDFSFNAAIGTSITDQRQTYLRLDSQTASLYYPNVFTVANINMSSSAYISEKNDARRQLQSVFATVQWGYKESLFLNLTARNDWASTLAFTESKNRGFFYPSVGLSWVVHSLLSLPEAVSYGKIRTSWSKVGNDIPLFVSNTVGTILAGGATQPNDKAPFNDLKSEMSSSFEVGTEWKFFQYRLDLDLTLYQTNTKNQLFTLPSSAGATYKYYFVNAGNIENKGIELSLGVIPVVTDLFRWKTQLNYSANRNVVKKLHKDLPTFIYGDEGFSSSYSMRLVEGGSFGDIYGKAFARDKYGYIIYGKYGLPEVVGDGNTVKVGNCNPDFLLGWGNKLTYKDFSLYLLIDGHFGGDVLSQTQAVMDQAGVSKVTGEARRQGYVYLEGRHIQNVQAFYEQVGGRSGVTEYYMYDATNIRLREVSIEYAVPKRWLERTKYVKDARLSLIGRNVCFLFKKAPFDPDAVLSTSNSNQGLDVFGMPTTRSIGFNIKFSF